MNKLTIVWIIAAVMIATGASAIMYDDFNDFSIDVLKWFEVEHDVINAYNIEENGSLYSISKNANDTNYHNASVLSTKDWKIGKDVYNISVEWSGKLELVRTSAAGSSVGDQPAYAKTMLGFNEHIGPAQVLLIGNEISSGSLGTFDYNLTYAGNYTIIVDNINNHVSAYHQNGTTIIENYSTTSFRHLYLTSLAGSKRTHVTTYSYAYADSILNKVEYFDPFIVDFQSTIVYDDTQGLINFTWHDSTAQTTNTRVVVGRDTITGPILICNDTIANFTGTYSCNVTGYYGFVNAYIQAYYNGDWNDKGSLFVSLRSIKLSDGISPEEGAFWTFAILLVVVMFGIFSPVGCIIATMFGLIVSYFLGLTPLITIPMLTVAAVLSIAIGIKLRT